MVGKFDGKFYSDESFVIVCTKEEYKKLKNEYIHMASLIIVDGKVIKTRKGPNEQAFKDKLSELRSKIKIFGI